MDGEEAAEGSPDMGPSISAASAGEAAWLERLTVRPAGLRRSSGSTALVTVITPRTFGVEHLAYQLHIDSTGDAVEGVLRRGLA